jgi:hypothetical protein
MQKRFWRGLVLGLLAFLLLNLLLSHLRSDCGLPAFFGLAGCADDIQRAGFPFLFLERGGFIGLNTFSVAALAADIGMALAVSAALGWAAARWEAGRRS